MDGQRHLFRVSLRLCSTVLSPDQHLANFFASSAALFPLPTSSAASSQTSTPRTPQPFDVDLLKHLKVRDFR